MSTTQNRLATGKKVNSALDNPGNFFTSQSLSNRASDLNSLLDSIGQAQKTLEAADQGITSLTKLVEVREVDRQAGASGAAARRRRLLRRSRSPATRSTKCWARHTGAGLGRRARRRRRRQPRHRVRPAPTTPSPLRDTDDTRPDSSPRSTPSTGPAAPISSPPRNDGSGSSSSTRSTPTSTSRSTPPRPTQPTTASASPNGRLTNSTSLLDNIGVGCRFHADRRGQWRRQPADHLRHRRRSESRRWPN